MKSLNDLTIFNDTLSFDNQNTKTYTRRHLHKSSIQPFLIYSILKNKFGLPNIKNTDESKVQWSWTFSYLDFRIEIYDWRIVSTSIAIYHPEADELACEQLAKDIHSLFEKSTEQYKKKLKSHIDSSTHKIIENPYVIYYSTAVNLMEVSSEIHEIVHSEFSQKQYLKELNDEKFDFLNKNLNLNLKKNDIYRSAFLMFLASFEGFLNILFELYLKKELREERLYSKISRENIDVKLTMTPVYCDGFKTVLINNEDNRFKNYLQLVNLRNNYVHAKLVKSHEAYIIQEDSYTFFVENEENHKNPIPLNINNLELRHIELAQNHIDGIIQLVLESMKPKARKEFESVIYKDKIGVMEVDGVYIIS